jgi:hypothetical protein
MCPTYVWPCGCALLNRDAQKAEQTCVAGGYAMHPDHLEIFILVLFVVMVLIGLGFTLYHLQ